MLMDINDKLKQISLEMWLLKRVLDFLGRERVERSLLLQVDF